MSENLSAEQGRWHRKHQVIVGRDQLQPQLLRKHETERIGTVNPDVFFGSYPADPKTSPPRARQASATESRSSSGLSEMMRVVLSSCICGQSLITESLFHFAFLLISCSPFVRVQRPGKNLSVDASGAPVLTVHCSCYSSAGNKRQKICSKKLQSALAPRRT